MLIMWEANGASSCRLPGSTCWLFAVPASAAALADAAPAFGSAVWPVDGYPVGYLADSCS